MGPEQVRRDTLWGLLHTTDLSPEFFEFQRDSRIQGGVSMTVRMLPPRSETEAADRLQVRAITQSHLSSNTNRAAAYRLACSSINVGAMVCGPEVGQSGGDPFVITKLFSAARWWGPGSDSWH